jgi:hypothetical protein
MFFQGERGKFLGIYALALTNGVRLVSALQLLFCHLADAVL